MLESVIEKDILKYLKANDIFAWNKKSHLKSTENEKGVSDCICVFDGRFLAIEIKNDDGLATLKRAIRKHLKGEPLNKLYQHLIDQYEFIKKVRASKGIAFFSASVEHTERVLNKYR